MDKQHHQYKNPPIEEAVCEFHFSPGEAWNLTIPGKLHSKLADEYAGVQQQNVVGIGLENAGDNPKLSYKEKLAKVLLVTNDAKRMVGVGEDVLSIHMLRPYQNNSDLDHSGWKEFYPRIKQALNAYWEVAHPKGVSRIGVQYFNRIVVSSDNGGQIKIEEYLKCASPRVNGLPDQVVSFVGRTEYSYDDGIRLILSQGMHGALSENNRFILGLDIILESVHPISQHEAVERVDALRDRHREVFESVITDKARDLFDAD